MVRVGGRNLVAADFGVVAWIGDVDVKIAIARVVRIEREADQASFPDHADRAADVDEHVGQQLTCREVEDADRAVEVSDEQPSGIAGRRHREHGPAGHDRDARRRDRGDVSLRAGRIEAVHQVVAWAANTNVRAVVAGNKDHGHWTSLRKRSPCPDQHRLPGISSSTAI